MLNLVLAATLALSLSACATASAQAPATWPASWWTPVSREGAPAWEILPQEAAPPEVILSKRNELGMNLSNLAPTPFEYRGRRYGSLEGLWQSLLYPESADDPRARAPGVEWRYTRDQVSAMSMFEAKSAGDLGYANLKKMGIDWVTFEGRRMTYWTPGVRGDHYDLVVAATWAKVRQNPRARAVLLSTRGLRLRPDHHQEPDSPPSWRYFEIATDIREQLIREGN